MKDDIANIVALTRALFAEKKGAALVEYGLLVGLIAVGCVVALQTLGGTIKGYFTTINASL